MLWVEGTTYWGGLDDGDGFDDLTFVHFGAWSVEITDNCCHASLVAKVSSEMDRLLLVILGEGLLEYNVSEDSSIRASKVILLTLTFPL